MNIRMNSEFTKKDVIEAIIDSAFKNSTQEIIFEELDNKRKMELFIFDCVLGMIYLRGSKIIGMDSRLFTDYVIEVAFRIHEFDKKLDKAPDVFMKLIQNRFENHDAELKKVKATQFTSNEYFCKFFFTAFVFNPLELPPFKNYIYKEENVSDINFIEQDKYKYHTQAFLDKLNILFNKS